MQLKGQREAGASPPPGAPSRLGAGVGDLQGCLELEKEHKLAVPGMWPQAAPGRAVCPSLAHTPSKGRGSEEPGTRDSPWASQAAPEGTTDTCPCRRG